MIFSTSLGDQFDVPDEWLRKAGAEGFQARRDHYRPAPASEGLTLKLAPVAAVQPPRRCAGVVGLHEDRAVRILEGFVGDAEMEPILAYEVQDGPHRYRVGDGYHRFHLSIAAGFSQLPLMLSPVWEPWMTGR